MKNFIATMTPMRISFVGGGSDFKEFYKTNDGGAVLNAAINKYVYIIINKYHDPKKCLLKYSKSEIVNKIGDIKHPLIKGCLRKMKIWGLDINSVADIPAGTGLGSSSSFTVGLINALEYYKGRSVSKINLANKACDIELNQLKLPTGKQDQFAASFGGLNLIEFKPGGKTIVKKINNTKIKDFLKKNVVIINTGFIKKNKIVLTEQVNNIKKGKEFFNHLIYMRDSVYEFKNSLERKDIQSCGEILDENWQRKKELAKGISNNYINDMYDESIKCGALGGKILGAGGRGYLMLICPESKKHLIKKKFNKFNFLNFEFDNKGSRRILKI